MRLTVCSLFASTGCALPNARFCFGDLCSRLWLWFADRRSSFPAPVTLNFFFAPECVFCFGISLDSCVLRRAEHHRHVPALEEGRGLDHADVLHVLVEAHEQVTAALRMLALATPEHDRHL